MAIMHFVHAPLEARELSHPTKRASVPFVEAPGVITNQEKYSHLRYGASNIGKTGCIPVAIYNALVLRARRDDAMNIFLPSFDEIVNCVKLVRAPLLGGRMGTDPYMIDKILDVFGVSCTEITERDSLAREMDEAALGTLFLITQWNDARRPLKGIHAYVAEKRDGGRWALYNRVYRDYPTLAHNLTEMLGRGRLIVAHKI